MHLTDLIVEHSAFCNWFTANLLSSVADNALISATVSAFLLPCFLMFIESDEVISTLVVG